jgi:cephalosporin hydroxylase
VKTLTNKEIVESWLGHPTGLTDEQITARATDQEIVGRFNLLYYFTGRWAHSTWLGYPILKYPTDLMVYQEIICELCPQLIIETGTAIGASALFFAGIQDTLGHGEVITIDVDGADKYPARPKHDRITYLTGSSVSQPIIDELNKRGDGKTIMVILDSDHSYEHVKEELRIYSQFVTAGQYLVVEDTNLSQDIVNLDGGPARAVEEFMKSADKFIVDEAREKHLLTCSPNGFLRKIK